MPSQHVQNVIDVLNKARSMELQAIHQYMNQHYNLDNMDYGEFAANIKRIAIDEMDHAEKFAERIKELDGEPVSEMAASVERGQAFERIYPYDVNLEDDTIRKYNEFLSICRDNHDMISARLFQDILEEEQAHYNYFDNTNKHIDKLGASYLAKIAGTNGDIGDTTMGFMDQGN